MQKHMPEFLDVPVLPFLRFKETTRMWSGMLLGCPTFHQLRLSRQSLQVASSPSTGWNDNIKLSPVFLTPLNFLFCCLVKVEIEFRSWVMAAAGTGGWWVGNLIISASYRVSLAYQYSWPYYPCHDVRTTTITKDNIGTLGARVY